jgi:hypothetical protein
MTGLLYYMERSDQGLNRFLSLDSELSYIIRSKAKWIEKGVSLIYTLMNSHLGVAPVIVIPSPTLNEKTNTERYFQFGQS